MLSSTVRGGKLGAGEAELRDGDVCPDETASGRTGLSMPMRPPKARSTGKRSGPWFPMGAYPATIRVDFETHLGNIGRHLECWGQGGRMSRTLRRR
jgi:hypothetical protein